MYKHFVFDIDGTLIDTERTGVLSLQTTIKELMDVDMPYEEVYRFFGIPSFKVASMLGYKEEELFGLRWEQRFQELMDLVEPFPGVEDVLKAVKAAGRCTGVVTSRSSKELGHDPFMMGFLKYIDFCVCSEDSERHKPFPDPMFAYMRKASETLGTEVLPSECLYLGDTSYDYGCGHDAGCAFALADWRNRGFQGIAADYRFTDAEGILKLLEI